MGEVWRGRDTRLERSVAIKVLPAEFAENAQLKLRFEREAKTISQLNDPHICTLYDVGHENGSTYLVMELLEGESLADRLAKGPLPIEQVLRYGVQIAAALDKAHRAGIVHRDLKPGNIMITKSGTKLLDFGLAKSTAAVLTLDGATQQKLVTQEGTILGTFQYMAPEQLEGLEADARTDIFAFGALLYEMATGRHAFEATTRTSLIAAIVQSEPKPISQIQPLTPPAFEHVVKKCLAKDRDDRWQSAHDIAEELKWIGEAGSQAGVAAPLITRRKVRDRTLVAVTVLALALAAVLGVRLWTTRTGTPKSVRAAIVAPPDHQLEYSRLDSAALTVSPDGRYVTFAASDGNGKWSLWLRPIDSTKAQEMVETGGGAAPFWSPDSRSIGFFSAGKLKRIDINGGPAVAIADAPDGRGGTWNRDGVILYAPSWRTPIYRVASSGGATHPVTTIDEKRGETTDRWPWFLPDGKHFLYLAGSHRVANSSDLNAIYLASIDSTERTLLLRARSNVIYVPGYILFVRDKFLLAQPFDDRKLKLGGDPIRVAEDVTYDSGFFRAAVGASTEGTLAYCTGSSIDTTQLAWYDRTGKRLSSVGSPLAWLQTKYHRYQAIRFSPDQTHVALDTGDTSDIWILDLARDTRTRFTSDPMNDASPVWSPDGKRIFYTNDRDVLGAVYEKPTNGLGRETLLLKANKLLTPTGISADGKFLAIDAVDPSNPESAFDVWVLPLTGKDAKPIPFIETEFSDSTGQFSPDGNWLTYISDETGRPELYAVSFPTRAEKRQLTNQGAVGYMWRGDGREIVYGAPDHSLMSIAVNGNNFSAPKLLFKPTIPIVTGDILRDGSRLLVAESLHKETLPITLVTNWSVGAQR
jgi:eukaryotic-like serine/threonine-protein kinase